MGYLLSLWSSISAIEHALDVVMAGRRCYNSFRWEDLDFWNT